MSESVVPPGYEFRASDDNFAGVPKRSSNAQAPDKALVRRKAWEVGKSPISNVFSTLLMMYFSGNHLSIMSVMLCSMMVLGPVKAFLGFRNLFRPYDEVLGSADPALSRAKLLYAAINCGVFAIALYKIGKLGILPFTEADYVRFLNVYSE